MPSWNQYESEIYHLDLTQKGENVTERLFLPPSMALPKKWPENIKFLQENVVDRSVSKEDMRSLAVAARALQTPRVKGVCKSVVIKRLTDPKHPAFNQNGLFALRDLDARSYILDYRGLISANSSQTSDYVLTFDESLGIDAEFQGNEARCINDYRGTGQKRPNAEFDHYFDQNKVLHMGVWVLHEKIPKGHEILVSYGKGFWEARHLLPNDDLPLEGLEGVDMDDLVDGQSTNGTQN